MPEVVVPPSLTPFASPTGIHRRGRKALFYGGAKTGKSWALASYPKPVLAASCGEFGIQPYLSEADGDKCFEIADADVWEAFVEFAVANRQHFASVVVDNVNLLWVEWMEYWEDKLQVDEIKAKNWRKVKGPWFYLQRQLMKYPIEYAVSCWIKDVVYQQKAAGPGVEGAIDIIQADLPNVEKTIPYTIDMIFRCDIVRDAKLAPTSQHKITFMGGRRPLSIPPTELYVGKSWTFNAKKPESVWQVVFGPMIERWNEGAVDVVGLDPREAKEAGIEVERIAREGELGRLLGLIAQATSLPEYKGVWERQIQPGLLELTPSQQADVRRAHDAKKKELGA